MSLLDREKWDRRYREGDGPDAEPRSWIVSLAPRLPSEGKALDAAGGSGRHALWLAARGLDTTLVDISSEGLGLAAQEARARGLPLRTRRLDLECEALPYGPWDLVLVAYYLNRDLVRGVAARLAPGGLFVMLHPTRRNLEKNARPPLEFLLAEGELRGLLVGLEVLWYDESWDEDRHEARVVARRA